MRHALVATLLFLTACGTDRLADSQSELRASPQVLRWDKAFIGYRSDRVLKLENAGRADVLVHLKTSRPFSLDSAELNLPAGVTIEVTVHLDPDAFEPIEGTLSASTDTTTITVALDAKPVLPPFCGNPSPCHTTAFDPTVGDCVETTLANGTACTAPCIDSGMCQDGACLGAKPTCDDGNACTTDACDADNGCVHLDASSSCVAPTVACKVAFCDPKTGCGVTDAVDGTPCGNADCVSADVCLSGQCKTVPVPEGATCAPQTPCQSPGVCHQQQCVRPPPAPMQPLWTYSPASGQNLVFTGTADAQGNLYWAECGGTQCTLVSFTRDGVERFRTPLRNVIDGGAMMRGAIVVLGTSVAVASNDTVELFRTSDGVEEWFHDLRAQLIPSVPTVTHLQVGPIVDLGSGRIAVRAVRIDTATGADPTYASWIVGLSTATGAPAWTWQGAGYVDGLLAQNDGTSWLFDYPITGSTPAKLVSLTRDGVVRTSTTTPASKPLATYGDRLLQWGGTLMSTVDGSKIADTWTSGGGGYMSLDPVTPLLGDGLGYLVGNDWSKDTADVALPGAFVRRFDPKTGDLLWSQRLDQMGTPSAEYATVTSQPALLDDGSVLVAKGDYVTGGAWQLVDVTQDGAVGYACDLPSTQQFASAMVLAGGRITVVGEVDGIVPAWTITSFDAYDTQLAQKGWVVLGGTPESTGVPK